MSRFVCATCDVEWVADDVLPPPHVPWEEWNNFQEDRLEEISARDTRDISFFWLTLSPWFDMLHIVINLIHQGVPICDISTTLLKVGRLDNVLEKHRVEMKGIIRSPHGYQIFGAIVLRIHTENTEIGQDTMIHIIDTEPTNNNEFLSSSPTYIPCLPLQRGERGLLLASLDPSHCLPGAIMPIETSLSRSARLWNYGFDNRRTHPWSPCDISFLRTRSFVVVDESISA